MALTTFSDLVQEACERVKRDALAAGMADNGLGLDAGGTGATAYADAVGVYLAFALSKAADRNSSPLQSGKARWIEMRAYFWAPSTPNGVGLRRDKSIRRSWRRFETARHARSVRCQIKLGSGLDWTR